VVSGNTIRVHASLDVPTRLNQKVIDGAVWTLASHIRHELNTRLAAQRAEADRIRGEILDAHARAHHPEFSEVMT